jgi:hypothetical protein
LQNAQTAADADAQAAAIKVKMLTKQAAEQKKALASRNKEAVQLQGELAAAQAALQKATTRLQVRWWLAGNCVDCRQGAHGYRLCTTLEACSAAAAKRAHTWQHLQQFGCSRQQQSTRVGFSARPLPTGLGERAPMFSCG